MKDTTFDRWLAGIFGQSESEIGLLLKDPTATRFLIAWSLFESRCFSGFVKSDGIQSFAERLTVSEGFEVSSIRQHVFHFHKRYRENSKLYKNLIHKQPCATHAAILGIPEQTLTSTQAVFFATFVVYRFRNNIFHGNKGVISWLNFTPEIDHCTSILRAMITHAETIQCQFKVT